MLTKITEIFGLSIHSYGLLIMIGFLCGLFVASRRAKLLGLPAGLITDLGVYSIVAGMLGAKVLYLMENHKRFDWTVLNLFDGNLSFTGAAVGAVAGLVLFFIFRSGTAPATRNGNRKKNRWSRAVWLVLFLALTTLAGARADYVRDDEHHAPGTDKAYDTRIFDEFGNGFVFYGGILPGIAAIWITLKVRRAPMRLVFDILAPSLMLGLAFGRIGCHLNGCCFGDVCEPDAFLSPVAITFPKWAIEPGDEPGGRGQLSAPYLEDFGGDGRTHSAMTRKELRQVGSKRDALSRRNTAERSLPRHATELIMSIDAFILFWILVWFSRKKRRPGSVTLLLGILYPVVRFCEEILRGDPVTVWNGLRISQWISLGILAAVIPATLLFWRAGKKQKEAVEELGVE